MCSWAVASVGGADYVEFLMRVFLLFSFLLVTTSTSVLAQADTDDLLHRLRNMMHMHRDGADDFVILRDGEFIKDCGEEGVYGVWLEQVAFGDIDGDGKRDVAMILVWHGAGSGTFHNSAAVLDVDGKARHVRPAPLSARRDGDPVVVDSVTERHGRGRTCSVWTHQSILGDGWPRWVRIRYAEAAPDTGTVECSR